MKCMGFRPEVKVTYHWVPGHIAIEGNERADKLAMEGASNNPPGRTQKSKIFTVNNCGYKLHKE